MPNGAQYTNIAAGYRGPWVDQLLQALGAPTTDSNRAAIRAWAASEGTVTSNNPLAISGQGPGATNCIAQCGSSSPIYAYSTASQGVQNTAAFLQGSYYSGVVDALKKDAGLAAIWNAVNASPWCTGCQNGYYPNALASAVYGPTFSTGGFATNLGVKGIPGGAKAESTAPAVSTTIFGKEANVCAVGEPGVLGVGKFCLLNYGQLQAILGGLIMISGASLMGLGLVLVAAYGLKSTAAKGLVPSGARPSLKRAPSAEAQDTAAYTRGERQGRNKALQAEGRRSGQAKAEREILRPSEEQERRDGFEAA